MLADLLLFRGKGCLLNCLTLTDQARLTTFEKNVGRCSRTHLSVLRQDLLGCDVAILVSVAVIVFDLSWSNYLDGSVGWLLYAHLPKMFFDRFSSVVHVGYGRHSSFLGAHFSSTTGFEFASGTFFSPFLFDCKAEVQLTSMEPLQRSKRG